MSTQKKRRPRYQRSANPPAMVFQPRDGQLLQALYDYEVLSRRHIRWLFWPNASKRAMEMRLSVLYHNGYINWPNENDRRNHAIPEPVVWLGWRGAAWLAGQEGLYVEIPKHNSEYQLRRFAKRLREQGFRWLREPRWSQLSHDLHIVDFRHSVEYAVSKLPNLTLEEWIPEGIWLTDYDVIEYPIKSRNGEIKIEKKGIRPDGYFSITDKYQKINGSDLRARFMLEVDMATHPTPRFGREKAAPGVAYIRSEAFKKRFGYQSGRWLVVTTGEVRMRHLIRQTIKETGKDARVFLFTTLDQLNTENILTDPIWHVTNKKNELKALFPDRS